VVKIGLIEFVIQYYYWESPIPFSNLGNYPKILIKRLLYRFFAFHLDKDNH